jgi:tetratricopeptide (TPR) repeat protein
MRWAFVLAALAFLLYARTWSFEMLFWDDNENVLLNPLVLSPNLAGLKRLFTSIFSTDYYPITYISLAFDHFLWGGRFFGYHVTQTLLHALNVFLVVLLARRWTNLTVAVIAGAWFAFHPVQVETVAWIAERKNVLGTAFFLLAWLAYDRNRLWSLLAFTAAALSHALVIVMPALLIAYELIVQRTRFVEALRRTWLFFVPAAFAAAMRVVGHAESGQLATPFRNATEGVLTMIAVAGQYLNSLFCPVRLSNHYTVTAVTSVVAPGILITVAWVLAWVLVARREPRWSLFAAVWFIIALAPVSQLVPHPTLRADRYLYIAVLPLFVLIARQRLLASATVIALLVLTWLRIPDWRDAKTLWSDCLAKNPRDVVALYSLSGCAVTANDWPTAERHLREAVRVKPTFAEAHERLGGVLAAQGKRAEARLELQEALKLKPHLTEARHNLRLLQ